MNLLIGISEWVKVEFEKLTLAFKEFYNLP